MCNKRKKYVSRASLHRTRFELTKTEEGKKERKEAIIVHEFEILFCDRANNCQYLSKVCKFNGFLKSGKRI